MNPGRILYLSVLIVGCTSCSWFDRSGANHEVSGTVKRADSIIQDLPEVDANSLEIEPVSVAELVAQIERVRPAPESPLYYPVMNRLAQLQLELVQEQLSVGEADFEPALETLHELRSIANDDASAAMLEYQIARLHDLAGREVSATIAPLSNIINEGVSPIALEAHFRRAEILFSNEQFADAEADFIKVATVPGEYQIHASYMLAWVRFKRSDLPGALEIAATTFEHLARKPEQLLELRADLLRVTVVALDYMEGADSLAQLMADFDQPKWQIEIYQALADWYLKKNRYADSAHTWQTFLLKNAMHAAAPDISLRVIQAQREAGFMSEIPQLEEQFIVRYGKQSEYFELHGEQVFFTYADSLLDMLNRYTQNRHAIAQQSGASADFELAANGYALWLQNFDSEPSAQEKRFLYAEVLEITQGFSWAAVEFERVIDLDPTTEFARESAYAVVLGSASSALDLQASIAANLRFTALYPSDQRAAACQLFAADGLFRLGQYGAAISAAKDVLGLTGESRQIESAHKLIAHSALEMKRYALAESTFRDLLQVSADQETVQQLLSAVFKQGEEAEQDGEFLLAIEHYDRLYDIDPESTLARDAYFDGVSLFERLEDYEQAIIRMENYRARYPENTGDETSISVRLAALYEGQGDVRKAALELASLSEFAPIEQAQAARFRAAELFLQVSDFEAAIEHFRYYSHNYREPVLIRFEAMHQLEQIYLGQGEAAKRRFWLLEIRDAYRNEMTSERTERASYLAADAIFELNEQTYFAYREAKLTLPLSESLGRKQALLQQNIDALQAVIETGVLEYVSQSQYRIAQLYELLAGALIAAEQPAGLNELEKEQYLFLLEEQAYPFEEQAIALHEKNIRLGWQEGWDAHFNQSLMSLQSLSPAKYRRQEEELAYVSAGQ